MVSEETWKPGEGERPKGSVIWVKGDGSWSYRPLEQSMASIERSSRWGFRLRDQDERIAKTREMEDDRYTVQEERIMRQREGEYTRVFGPGDTGVALTGLDYMARRRMYSDRKWQRKWELRKAKMDHRRY